MNRATRLAAAAALALISAFAAGAQEWDPDVSGCEAALERFFFNGVESRANLQRLYFDREGRVAMSAFLNEDGSERSRKVYRYDELGELVEFSIWDRDGASWRRWWHALAERKLEGGVYTYTERTSRYAEAPRETRVVKKDASGRLLYEAERGYDESYSIRTYNDRGDLAEERYENEKSGGPVAESFAYRYEGGLPTRVERSRKGVPVELVENAYVDGLLASSALRNLASGAESSIAFEYAAGRLVRKTWLGAAGERRYELYYEYDGRGRLLVSGEKAEGYDRYWRYDYE